MRKSVEIWVNILEVEGVIADLSEELDCLHAEYTAALDGEGLEPDYVVDDPYHEYAVTEAEVLAGDPC